MNYVLVGQKSFCFFPPISDISSFFFFENLFLKLYLDLHVGFENVLAYYEPCDALHALYWC